MREVIHELGADLSQSTHLSKVAQDEPGATIAIRRRHHRDVTRLVGVPKSTVTNVDLAAMHFASDRLAGELLESEVNRCFNQWHATELHIAAGEDLASDRARGTDHKIGADTENGVIGRLKEGVQSLRSAIGAVPGDICSAALARSAIGLGCNILRCEAANDQIGDPCRDQYRCKPNNEVWHQAAG